MKPILRKDLGGSISPSIAVVVVWGKGAGPVAAVRVPVVAPVTVDVPVAAAVAVEAVVVGAAIVVAAVVVVAAAVVVV